jgi:hypothetical protein
MDEFQQVFDRAGLGPLPALLNISEIVCGKLPGTPWIGLYRATETQKTSAWQASEPAHLFFHQRVALR